MPGGHLLNEPSIAADPLRYHMVWCFVTVPGPGPRDSCASARSYFLEHFVDTEYTVAGITGALEPLIPFVLGLAPSLSWCNCKSTSVVRRTRHSVPEWVPHCAPCTVCSNRLLEHANVSTGYSLSHTIVATTGHWTWQVALAFNRLL